jgi:hypothetical protein
VIEWRPTRGFGTFAIINPTPTYVPMGLSRSFDIAIGRCKSIGGKRQAGSTDVGSRSRLRERCLNDTDYRYFGFPDQGDNSLF